MPFNPEHYKPVPRLGTLAYREYRQAMDRREREARAFRRQALFWLLYLSFLALSFYLVTR